MNTWFVIQTKPGKEFHVERIFREASFEVYVPKHKNRKIIKPFFPGYGFVRFSFPGEYTLVKYTRGVKRIVGFRTGPTPLPDLVIEEIRSREKDGLIAVCLEDVPLKEGDKIEVTEGAFAGLEGIFQKNISGRERVAILLNCVSYHGRMLIERQKIRKHP
ncbi:MAG: hypothetical protein FJY81_00740 [Candidatus Aminicenantes bacterium]|nr:hypothetical protein [Candidatus Aminicenantes bacterium]